MLRGAAEILDAGAEHDAAMREAVLVDRATDRRRHGSVLVFGELDRRHDLKIVPAERSGLRNIVDVTTPYMATASGMEANELIATLEGYENELDAILGRFTETESGLQHISKLDNQRYTQMVYELDDLFQGGPYSGRVMSEYRKSLESFYGSPSHDAVTTIKSIVAAAITLVRRDPLAFKPAEALQSVREGDKIILKLAGRLHQVVCQLRHRHDERPTLDVADEYDVQDLLHALLKIEFNDIRPEEPTPSHAGSSARIDFVLPEISAVVETKMTRPGLNAKKLGEELIIDIARYKTHPDCKTLFCVVYDPGGRIANPRGIESDLAEQGDDNLKVCVRIVPS